VREDAGASRSIPGSTPSTEVYVPVNGRVYRINVYGEKLDRKKGGCCRACASSSRRSLSGRSGCRRPTRRAPRSSPSANEQPKMRRRPPSRLQR
jgi:hypothetical protein